jgi:hypothetical protein
MGFFDYVGVNGLSSIQPWMALGLAAELIALAAVLTDLLLLPQQCRTRSYSKSSPEKKNHRVMILRMCERAERGKDVVGRAYSCQKQGGEGNRERAGRKTGVSQNRRFLQHRRKLSKNVVKIEHRKVYCSMRRCIER